MSGNGETDTDRNVQEIIEDIWNMGQLVRSSIEESVVSLKEQNTSIADNVIRYRDEINKQGDIIEDKCTAAMTRKVSSKQLRILKGSMKMIIELENITSLAVEIAFITKATSQSPHIKPLVDIPRMSVLLQEMLVETLDALKSQDSELAENTAAKDDEIDALFDQIRRELITYMIEDPKKIANASHLTFASRYLERMGDHINNMCEIVVFMVTGLKVNLN